MLVLTIYAVLWHLGCFEWQFFFVCNLTTNIVTVVNLDPISVFLLKIKCISTYWDENMVAAICFNMGHKLAEGGKKLGLNFSCNYLLKLKMGKFSECFKTNFLKTKKYYMYGQPLPSAIFSYSYFLIHHVSALEFCHQISFKKW